MVDYGQEGSWVFVTFDPDNDLVNVYKILK